MSAYQDVLLWIPIIECHVFRFLSLGELYNECKNGTSIHSWNFFSFAFFIWRKKLFRDMDLLRIGSNFWIIHLTFIIHLMLIKNKHHILKSALIVHYFYSVCIRQCRDFTTTKSITLNSFQLESFSESFGIK